MAEYRNQIAHNKLLGSDALPKIIALHAKLKSNIESAIANIRSFSYSEEEIATILGKISESKNASLVQAVETLKRNGLSMENIFSFIEGYKSNGKLRFSSFALINEMTGGYELNNPINRAVGRILGEMKSDLSIRKTDEVDRVIDDRGTPTNSTIWEIVL